MKVKNLIIVVVMMAVLGPCNVAWADHEDKYWDGGGTGNNWSTPENWLGDVEPDYTDNVIIGGYSTWEEVQITTGSNEECDDLYLGYSSDASISMNGGILKVVSTAKLGLGSKGTFTQNDGTVSVGEHPIGNPDMYIGYTANGEYYLNGGTLNTSHNLLIGSDGDGILELHGETNIGVGGTMYVGDYTGYGLLHSVGIGGAVPVVNIADSLVIGENGEWVIENISGMDVVIGKDFKIISTDESKWAGSQNVEMTFNKSGGGSGTFEMAGTIDGGFMNNFALGGLEVSDDFALQLVNLYDNGNGAAECLFTEALNIKPDATLDIYNNWLYVNGNVESTLNGWIADGRLFNSLGMIEAVYMPDYNWTYVTPEPATVTLLGLGALALMRKHRT